HTRDGWFQMGGKTGPGRTFGRGVDGDGAAVRVGRQTRDRREGRCPAVKSLRAPGRDGPRGPPRATGGGDGTTARGRVAARGGRLGAGAIVPVGPFEVRAAGAALPCPRSSPPCECLPPSWW